jgi:hypothetical protein
MQPVCAVTSFWPESNTSAFPVEARPSGEWIKALRVSDINRLWVELHNLVRRHPLARAACNTAMQSEEGTRHTYTDLTQELFVQLLSKSRFQHYLDTEMTDAEIEREISQLELSNLLTLELRKRHPESYRLARRIATLIQTSEKLRRFDTTTTSETSEPHRRLSKQIYGLCEWLDDKARRNIDDAEQRVQIVPMRQRDTRLVGRTGDVQIVITNADLERLIVSVLQAVDAPLDVRTLRNLVMARLPVMNNYLVPLGGDDSDKQAFPFELVDLRETPEQELLRREAECAACDYVDEFLAGLQASVRGKIKQYKRILGVLWYCYLIPQHRTQLEVAALLEVSDTTVSDYRHRIDKELRTLSFFELEEARRFEISLRERVRALVLISDQECISVIAQGSEKPCTR